MVLTFRCNSKSVLLLLPYVVRAIEILTKSPEQGEIPAFSRLHPSFSLPHYDQNFMIFDQIFEPLLIINSNHKMFLGILNQISIIVVFLLNTNLEIPTTVQMPGSLLLWWLNEGEIRREISEEHTKKDLK